MKLLKPAVFTALLLSAFSVHGNTFFEAGDTLVKGTFILHKFQQAIGKEFYSIMDSHDSVVLSSNFKFTDRGQEVPLQTMLVLTSTGKPAAFRIKGSTSRASVINDEVRIEGDSVWIRVNETAHRERTPESCFPISGYAPVSVQMMLVKYWNKLGRPTSIRALPAGNITITHDGVDTLSIKGESKILERHFVKGLIWGKELIWTDAEGNLVSLFTNDAEGDKFEAIQEAYVTALPSFIGMAARYGMADMKAAQVGSKESLLALKGGSVIDVVTGKVLEHATVLIQDGVIVKIGSVNKVKIPSKARILDITGKSVLPGLWDMHAHFQQVEWGPAYLAAGVTTVRDCGNEFDFINAVKKAIDNHEGIGPGILKTGIVDGDGPMALGIVRVNTKEDAARVVKMYKDNGFVQIKIYSSVKPEMIKAIATEAHANGLTVTGHVPRGVTAPEAVAMGQDQINHFTFVYQAMRVDPNQMKVSLTDPKAEGVLKILKDKNIVIDPTLGIYEWVLRPLDQPVDAFEPGVNYLPEDMRAIFRNTGLPPEKAAERRQMLETGKEIVLALHKMGVPVVAGTDMMVPGFSLLRELELYHEAGFTPLEAIQSATLVPARVMKVDHETGSVDVGKKGDVIVVDGNPLVSLSTVRNVAYVVKDGYLYLPSELRKIIDFKP